jgi:hypothetical protein
MSSMIAGELGVDDGVRGALDDAGLVVGDVVTIEPVVAGLHHGEHREQHGQVRLGRLTHHRHRRHEDDAAVEDVRCRSEQQHHDQGGEQPVEHERQERQLEDVEADVRAELGVDDAELTGISEQQPVLPQRDGRKREQQREQQSDAVAHDAQALAEEFVEPFDVGVHIGREVRRSGTIGDEQIEPGDHDERQEEHHEQRDLGTQHAPEHVAAAERVVPEVVDVEPGDRTTEDQHEQEEPAEADQDSAPADPATWTVDREVR